MRRLQRALVHVVFAALGISAILAASALAFTVVKYVGAAYLLYLGFQALRSAGAGGTLMPKAVPQASAWGLSTGRSGRPAEPQGGDLLHGLPAAVRAPEHGAVPLQLLVLGVLVVVVAIVVECALVLLAARATTALRSNPAVSQWLDRALARSSSAWGYVWA